MLTSRQWEETHQLGVQPASIATEFIIESAPPERRMGGSAVSAMGLDIARDLVAKGGARCVGDLGTMYGLVHSHGTGEERIGVRASLSLPTFKG
jgi:hypothetical protein